MPGPGDVVSTTTGWRGRRTVTPPLAQGAQQQAEAGDDRHDEFGRPQPGARRRRTVLEQPPPERAEEKVAGEPADDGGGGRQQVEEGGAERIGRGAPGERPQAIAQEE